jgi:electron transfer flavoprotein alpha subunit
LWCLVVFLRCYAPQKHNQTPQTTLTKETGMAERHEVWAFSEKPALLAELIAGALQLAEQSGGEVVAVVLGPRSDAEIALAQGAQRVYWLGELPTGRLVDDYVPTLAKALQEHRPDILLVGSTRRGRAIAGRLAARLEVTALADVLEFTFPEQKMQVRHMIFGGGAVRVDRPTSEMVVATVGPGTFQAGAGGGSSGEISEVPFVPPDWQVTLRERKPRAVSSVNLPAARKIICAGRGIARKEDLSLVQDLAQALGAEVACSRPLAEGLGWLARERYIGISGAHVRPDLYLGVGVSGQVQHLIGMSGSRIVVAINKDSGAPIFAHSDYNIVGDLYQVVPALMREIKGGKQ